MAFEVQKHSEQNRLKLLELLDKPLSHSDMAQVVDAWHAEYIDIPQEELFELVMAANYLDIKPLLELSCAKVAS